MLTLSVPLIGGLSGVTGERPGGIAVSGEQDACAPAGANAPVDVLTFDGTTHVFEHGGITAVADGWVMAGVEVDAGDPVGGQPPFAPSIRIISQAEGRLSPPARESRFPMEAPVPVVLSAARWGLLWVEAEPIGKFRGTWPPDLYSRVWFAEHRPLEGWSRPKLILEAPLGVDWTTGRTIVAGRQAGALLMVVANENLRDVHIMFGPVDGPLRPIPLPDTLSPRAATFLVDGGTGLTLVAQVVPASGRGSGTLVTMRSTDRGRSWSAPDSIWSVPRIRTLTQLRLMTDSAGVTHIFWSDGETLSHLIHSGRNDRWIESPLPPPSGVLMRWAAGIDRCGRATVVRNLLRGRPDWAFDITQWRGDVRRTTIGFPAHLGINMIDGTGSSGRWYIAWSGKDAQSATPNLKEWLVGM